MWTILEAIIDTTAMQDHYNTLKHILAIETGRWSTIPFSKDSWLCHFFSFNMVENGSCFVLIVPYIITLEIVSITMWECRFREPNIFLSIGPSKWTLTSISRRLSHSATLKTILLVPLTFMTSRTLKSISFHFNDFAWWNITFSLNSYSIV